MTETTGNPRLQTADDIHIPAADATARPCCGAWRGFIVCHFDLAAVNCERCMFLAVEEAIATGDA